LPVKVHPAFLTDTHAMQDPNPGDNELDRDFEPLRVGLAIGALILGVLMSLH
jgi:hypothetical protein